MSMNSVKRSILFAVLSLPAMVFAETLQMQEGEACPLHTVKEKPAYVDTRTPILLSVQEKDRVANSMRQFMDATWRAQKAIIEDRFDEAARIFEQELGLSSMESNALHDVADRIPKEMRRMMSDVMRRASRMSLKAQEWDTGAVLKEMPVLIESCNSCHKNYRIQTNQ